MPAQSCVCDKTIYGTSFTIKVLQLVPQIAWSAPAPIVYGTALLLVVGLIATQRMFAAPTPENRTLQFQSMAIAPLMTSDSDSR